MIRRPPRSTRTDTPFPYTTLFRSDFLPAFANMKVQNTPDGSLTDVRPAKGPITVRQLLTHTAGLGYNIIQKGPIKAAYDRAGIVGGQASRLPIPGFAEVAPADRKSTRLNSSH